MTSTVERQCPQCGKSFTKDSRAKYCSALCRQRASKLRQYGSEHIISLPPSTVGSISEMRVISDLLSQGYYVFKSVSPNSPCDIIIIHGDITLKVEVGTATTKLDGTFASREKHGNYDYDIRALITRDGSTIEYQPALPDISQPMILDASHNV